MQNQARAGKLGDPSIFPDLCASHRRQLRVMLENHSKLRDICLRCAKAKEELSQNLHTRLRQVSASVTFLPKVAKFESIVFVHPPFRWIMYVEQSICEIDNKLLMYHESVKRLQKHLKIVQQIHLAPQLYLSAVREVVRRRNFSKTFLEVS